MSKRIRLNFQTNNDLAKVSNLFLYFIEAPEAPAAPADTRRKRSAQNDFYENFFALHGEYPKAFVTGPGIYGVGNSGISTVYDVRSSPMGAIGR